MNPGYAAIGLYRPGQSNPSLLADKNGKVVIFDTPEMAQQVIPLLGGGRITSWSIDEETVWWTPIQRKGINRACIVTGYDVYNLPAGLPVQSETKSRAWRNHVHWAEWLKQRGHENAVPHSAGMIAQ